MDPVNDTVAARAFLVRLVREPVKEIVATARLLRMFRVRLLVKETVAEIVFLSERVCDDVNEIVAEIALPVRIV